MERVMAGGGRGAFAGNGLPNQGPRAGFFRRLDCAGRARALAVGLALWAAAPALGQEPMAEFPIQSWKYQQANHALPLEQKVMVANLDLINRQHKTNLDYDQNIRPTIPQAGNPMVGRVKAALAALPPEVQKLAGEAVTAIYLVENDFGTGTTEAVKGPKGEWRYAYIVLNLTALDKTANRWGSWKEDSAFRPQKGYGVRMTLEKPEEDTLEGAIRFIFLHELGHAVGQYLRAHNSWEETGKVSGPVSQFIGISWQKKGNRLVSRWASRYPVIHQTHYYQFAKSKLKAGMMAKAYTDLAFTDFPSLYGATNAFDDFAETFALYSHIRLMGRPYQVEVVQDGAVAAVYHSCLQENRCENKVEELERLWGLPHHPPGGQVADEKAKASPANAKRR